MSVQCYDEIASLYHLIYADWGASVARQGANLESIIVEHWGHEARTTLDVSCGIGTQTLGLAQRGFTLTGSDLSAQAIERAKAEASKRGVEIDFSVADMREVFDHHRRTFDVVICCDNSLPHLLSDTDIVRALEQFYQCTEPGGGCIISVRDYGAMNLQGVQVHPFGMRSEGDTRYFLFQVWEFEGSIYDLSMYFVKDDGSAKCETTVIRSKYYAVTTDRLMSLLAQVGFEQVERLDGRFFQPILIGTRPR